MNKFSSNVHQTWYDKYRNNNLVSLYWMFIKLDMINNQPVLTNFLEWRHEKTIIFWFVYEFYKLAQSRNTATFIFVKFNQNKNRTKKMCQNQSYNKAIGEGGGWVNTLFDIFWYVIVPGSLNSLVWNLYQNSK